MINLTAKNDINVKRAKSTISVVQKFIELSVLRIIKSSLIIFSTSIEKPEIDK